MTMSVRITSLMALVFISALCGRAAQAQQAEPAQEAASAPDESQWDYQQGYAYRPDTRAIIHQKAQWNAHQRMYRLAAMRWYGMHNARPTAAPTPFTSLYSPVWQMPGGRPYAWHTRGTTVIVTEPSTRTHSVTR